MQTKIKIQIAEKEAQLLEDDRSDSSRQRCLRGKSGFEFLPTMSDEEKIEKWRTSCADKNEKPKDNPEQSGKKEPPGEGRKTPKNEAQRDKPVVEGNRDSSYPAKANNASGNASY